MFQLTNIWLVLCLFAVPLVAQDARGTIVGRVTDQTGANVAHAIVRATNLTTGVAVVASSNDAGNYALPYLVPGIYTVITESTGFRKFIRENVQVRVADTVELNVQLSVGDVAESIDVKAETPLLSTAEASLGQVVDERRILELPLFSGNAMEFALLAPGTTNGTDMRLRKAAFNNAPSQFSTDGSGIFGNEFTIDGVTNTYSDGANVRVAFSPPQASISEFKVETSAFDASLGHTTGSTVNISTKGGTNDVHGTVWWFLRHSAFDTPDIFQNRSGQKLAIYQDNRYGIAGGGPVTIPKVYSGKNKTFWYFTYEANKFGSPSPMTASVPRDAWRNGDLSDLLKIGANYQIYDPSTIQPAAGGRFSRQPFPENIIPANRIDPVAKKILDLYPRPNQTGPTVTADGRNNFFISNKALEDYWTTIGRFDHAFSEKDRMFIRVHRDFWQEDKNRTFGDDVNGLILNRINRGIAFDEVHVFNPTFLFNFRYGVTQQEFPEHRVSQGFDLASLGFGPSFVSLFPKQSAVPNITAGSLTTLSGSESGDGVAASLNHTFTGNFTWMKGNHNVRFGPEFRIYRVFFDRHSGDTSPILSFSNTWGKGPLDNSTAPPVGGELVSLLLGIPGGSATRSGSFAVQDRYFAGYVQDDWKITRKLTLNLGLRVEHESPVTERFDRSATAFLGGVANPIAPAAIANYARSPIPELPLSQFKVNGGLTFAGNGNPREFWDGQALGWMPRIGIAYQLTPLTVFRAGYGIFYGSIGSFKGGANLAGFSQSTPIEATNDNGLTFKTKLNNPLPGGLLPPLGPKGGLETNLGQSISYFPVSRNQPYAQRWSIGFQRQLPASFMIESSYVGNRGTRLPVSRNINALPAQYLSKSPTRDAATINFLSANFPSPFFGLNPQYTSSTIARQGLLVPYPEFGGVTYLDPVGYSWYHSLQSRVERRLTKGFTLQWAWTWSKAMDASTFLNASDAMPYESLSDIDRGQRFTGSGLWELPFGKGRRFGSKMARPLEFFAGGWQLSGAWQRQSGQPIGWGNIQITGDSTKLLLPSDERNADRWFNTTIFERDSTKALASNIRTFPLRFGNVRFDSQRRWDFSLNKTFRINERFKMKFRADTFNALNEPVLRGPTTDPTNSNFGKISAQEPTRSWQFSLNLAF